MRGLPRWYDDPTANGATVYPTYVAKQIDSPDVAASVDPDNWTPVEAQAIVSKPAELSREAVFGLSRFGGIAESDRSEYVKHTANLLRFGKLRLSGYAHAGGTVFVMGGPKLGSDGLRRLREVWHGTRVSNAAVAPPKPPHLADVTSLTHLQLRGDELLRVSKRDAQCCFDQLKLYPELGVWMARPLVKKHELITIGGLSAAEINEMCANPEATNLDAVFPIPVTWVMGFSWSSFVSQTTMLGICSEAGLSGDLGFVCRQTNAITNQVCFRRGYR